MGSYFARTAWRSVVMTDRSRLVWNLSSGQPCYCQKKSQNDLFVLRYCPSWNSLCTKHDIFSSKKWKLQPLALTVYFPDNKRRPLSRGGGGGLHSQMVGRYRRTVSTKYPICYCLKLRLVLTGNSRGGQIQRNNTFSRSRLSKCLW